MCQPLPEFRKHGFDNKFLPLTLDVLHTPAPSVLSIVNFIEQWSPHPIHSMKILDFGCGRGELVAELRRRGGRAFGVEQDPRFVASGELLAHSYKDEFPILSVVDRRGTSAFPDQYFDLVLSDQVFEHVANLDGVVGEISRVLRRGGVTCHHFPGRFRVSEPHFFLPIVHWLPKNRLRREAIKWMLAVGLSKQFFPEFGLDDRADIIFTYSVQETYYRSIREIEIVFSRNGLRPTFGSGMKAYVKSRIGSIPATLPLIPALVAATRMVLFSANKI